MNIRKLLALISFVVIFLVSLFLYLNKDLIHVPKAESDFPNPVLKTGVLAPELEMTDIEGKTHRLSEYRGKVVLINFWATWFPPCIAEMPALESAYVKLRD